MEPAQRSKILLVFVDPILFPYAQPYGPLILKAHLNAKSLSCTVLLPYQAADPVSRLERALADDPVPIVGFSFRNFDAAGIGHRETPRTFLPSLEMLVAAARRTAPDALIVLGGAGFSLEPATVLRVTGAQLGFIGPAEGEFADFCLDYLNALSTGVNPDLARITARFPSSILNPTLAGRTDHSYSTTRKNDRGSLPFTSEYLPYEFHTKAADFGDIVGGTFPVRTKTGCSMNCSYCVVPLIEPLSLRPITHIIQDLSTLENHGYGRQIFFADGEFNLPTQERCFELCRTIRQALGQTVKWRCYVCPSEVSLKIAEEMALAGCVGVGITVDSFSDPIRHLMGKKCNGRAAARSVEAFLAAGIETSFALLFGAPGETIHTICSTVEIARELVERGAHVSISAGLVLYEGTPLAAQTMPASYLPYVWKPPIPSARPIFCSPAAPDQVYASLKEKLRGLNRVHWTSSNRDQEYFKKLASALDLVHEGHPVEAIAAIDSTGGAHDSADPRRIFLKAKALRKLGQLDDAAKLLRSILQLQPTTGEVNERT